MTWRTAVTTLLRLFLFSLYLDLPSCFNLASATFCLELQLVRDLLPAFALFEALSALLSASA
ncbi:hypothetical protein O9992_02960 [Vibrio lentus]|nr:hypothetical protein [Vibrio lentus]